MCKADRIVRVVFASSAGVDFASLNTTIHYGAPRTVDKYFQQQHQLYIGCHPIFLTERTCQSLRMLKWR